MAGRAIKPCTGARFAGPNPLDKSAPAPGGYTWTGLGGDMNRTSGCLLLVLLFVAGCSGETPPSPAVTGSGSPAVALPAAVPSVPATQSLSEFNILGFRTGMSEQQVRETLAGATPALRIDQEVGGESLQQIIASSANAADGISLVLHFSPPPGEPRLLGIERTVEGGSSRTRRQLLNNLMILYGTPTFEYGTGRNVLGWTQPGRPQCVWDGDSEISFWGLADMRQHREEPTRKITLPADPSECGIATVAILHGAPDVTDPVTRFESFIVDVAAVVAAERRLAD